MMLPLRGPRVEPHLLERGEAGRWRARSATTASSSAGPEPAARGGRPVRSRPVDGVLVGSSFLAQLLALRAVATGARVVVETARPELWSALAQNAGGGQQVVAVVPVRRVGPLGASAASPVLLVRDCGARPPKPAQAKTLWQTTMTLVPYLDPGFAGRLGGMDLLALQRVSPQEAAQAARAARLSRNDVQLLPTPARTTSCSGAPGTAGEYVGAADPAGDRPDRSAAPAGLTADRPPGCRDGRDGRDRRGRPSVDWTSDGGGPIARTAEGADGGRRRRLVGRGRPAGRELHPGLDRSAVRDERVVQAAAGFGPC